MDSVPVKISENYKPPPRVYQLPQAIANRLSLPLDHYNVAPQFAYDFDLERKVLAKIPEWRSMRECEREARRERKERREQQRLRAVEEQQKQLLGAVTYPSAEELSSASSDSDEAASTPSPDDSCEPGAAASPEAPRREQEACIVAPAQTNCFHNILQPTILPRREESGVSQVYGGKHASAFNYKDFEDDTSSPFDNIELKTINDLDILAQVLHQTQLKAKSEHPQDTELKAKENTQRAAVVRSEEHLEERYDSLNAAKDIESEVTEPALAVATPARFVQPSVVSDAECRRQNEQNNIPNALDVIHSHHHQPSSNYAYQTPPVFASYSIQQQEHLQQHAYIPYNQFYNGVLEHHTHTQSNYGSYVNNQRFGTHPNSIAPPIDCNGAYYSPPHASQYVTLNANNVYQSTTQLTGHESAAVPLAAPPSDDAAVNLKAKSVPDILRELSDEVRNSELRRRNRNLSYNHDDLDQPTEEEVLRADGGGTLRPQRPPSYVQLEVAARKLAKNISMMGFPLERVAKIVERVGADDKKIIEHLIVLSELMDLGFDEAKISDALVRFDNNKEKALEYLIS